MLATVLMLCCKLIRVSESKSGLGQSIAQLVRRENEMSIRKDAPYETQPIASEVQAEAADNVCSRFQYDHDLAEPVRRTYARQ